MGGGAAGAVLGVDEEEGEQEGGEVDGGEDQLWFRRSVKLKKEVEVSLGYSAYPCE